jgi:hypothetical protein
MGLFFMQGSVKTDTQSRQHGAVCVFGRGVFGQENFLMYNAAFSGIIMGKAVILVFDKSPALYAVAATADLPRRAL